MTTVKNDVVDASHLFQENEMSIGLALPLEPRLSPIATMKCHHERAVLADELGFSALWLRDVPLFDPAFGDAGTIYDPFVYAGYLASATANIMIATSAVIIPHRHPLHLAKAAASVSELSGGRFLFGVASGDRPIEYPAFGVDFEAREETFRDHLTELIKYWHESFPKIETEKGAISGLDILPKPSMEPPVIVVGRSRQSVEWIANHASGWFTYPRDSETLRLIINEWKMLTPSYKPFITGLSIDLKEDPDAPATPIRFGFSAGRKYFISHLEAWRDMGVSHCSLAFHNMKRPIKEAMQETGQEVLPHFQTKNK